MSLGFTQTVFLLPPATYASPLHCNRVAILERRTPFSTVFTRVSSSSRRYNSTHLVIMASDKKKEEFKFGPDAEKNAFGRDPKQETAFWMTSAKEVLENKDVKDAVEEHKKNGGDGKTDEQRAYEEFIRSLDSEKV